MDDRSRSGQLQTHLVEEMRRAGGVIVGRHHPRLRHAIRVARERGWLRSILRGVYAAHDADDFATRCAALFAADPDAILTGRSAAIALGWAPPRAGEAVQAASRRLQGHHAGFRFSRRRIEPDLVTHRSGVRCTSPELTALDLARAGDPAPISDVLRRGATVAGVAATLDLTRSRRGNHQLRRWLYEARDAPFSPAELVAHQALRAGSTLGWQANVVVELPHGPGRRAIIDLALPELGLAIEIDGFAHHASHASFHRDRARDLALARLGWQVVRVSASWVMDLPEGFVAAVEDLAAQRAALLGRPVPRRRPARRRPLPALR